MGGWKGCARFNRLLPRVAWLYEERKSRNKFLQSPQSPLASFFFSQMFPACRLLPFQPSEQLAFGKDTQQRKMWGARVRVSLPPISATSLL